MAYVPTFRLLGEMKAKDIPSHLVRNASFANFRAFNKDVNLWYWEKYVQKNSAAVGIHLMMMCSFLQFCATAPYHIGSMCHYNLLI